jgi:hypothetical protein
VTVTVTVAGKAEANIGTEPILPDVPNGAQLSYYVRFESALLTRDWLPLDSFSFGVARPGGLLGKPQPHEAVLVLGSGSHIVDLSELTAKGTRLISVEVEAYQTVGTVTRLVEEYRFGCSPTRAPA